MRGRFVAVDLSEGGGRISFGKGRTAGLFPEGVCLPPSGGGFPCAVEEVGGSVARAVSAEGRRVEALLLSLPDRHFRIALVAPRLSDSKGRLDEYARWKLRSDWNLDEETILHDWQLLNSRWSGKPVLLLSAVERRVAEEAGRIAEAAGLPLALLLPRCLAAWNGWTEGERRKGPSALVLRDGAGFTVLGAESGRMAYVRSRLCEDGEERDREVAETLRHFAETRGSFHPVPADDWGEAEGSRVAEGLFHHPLVSGVFR